jgi:beta-lactamase superfamily II metal-dependent hydrolase
MIDRTAPSVTELEVSVFGRGFGESILVHIGDSRWILIDSLSDSDGVPSPLRYLSEIRVDPKVALRLILATHWHDDHIEGLSAIYGEALNATLAMPQAMNEAEVKAFVDRVRVGGSERISSGVQELNNIAVIQKNTRRAPIRLAKANTVLLRESGLSHGHAVEIEALSPSDADVNAFITSLATASLIQPGQRVMPFSQNDVSVALWVSVGSHRLLLGADLEESGNAQRGWQAVLTSPAGVTGRASVIKVPHHGSHNGHHQPVWDTLLIKEPLAALTAWNRGRKLPTIADARRILSLTPNAFVTSSFERKSPQRPAAVTRTLREAGIDIRAKLPSAAQIRLRLDLSDSGANWTADLFNEATRLDALTDLL